jgi:uncharacterized protein (UPF0371 family)
MIRHGFDNDLYIQKQSEQIVRRITDFGGKLYLEFGGKLFDDFHAARVLPGFMPDSKLQMLKKLADRVEIVIVINSSDIEKNKIRRDLGITYDSDVLRLIDEFRGIGLFVGSVVISRYDDKPQALAFKQKLEKLGVKVYLHYSIDGYPYDVDKIVCEEGLGGNDYIETSRPLVVVTAPGPGSGKMAVCLSQLFHEHKRGIKAGYAKFETFPIWNLPLNHSVNLAYEAATADLKDVNMIDPWHLEAYGKTTVNYNRDVEIFPVLNAMFKDIWGESPYKSPTDMGVNMAGFCIVDDAAVRKAAEDEIIRRYYNALCDVRKDRETEETAKKIELLMKKCGITSNSRKVVVAALEKSEATDDQPAVALELEDGRIITGKTSKLLGASSAMLLNAIKTLAGIPDEVDLISPEIIQPVQRLKTEILGNNNPRLHLDELLVALTVCANSDENAKLALAQIPKLKCCEAHSTVILAQVDEDVFRKLGINLTCEPVYQTKKFYHG